MEIQIGTIPVGPSHAPCIVAEISANHNGSLERAIAIIDAVKRAGVHAVKLQTYRADTLTLPYDREEFYIRDGDSLWKDEHRYQLYQKGSLPWEWHRPIFDHCKKLGLVAFSTPFDETAVDFLEELNVPCYKIGSPELVDIPLLKKVASTRKPILLSTGGGTLSDIDEAVRAVRQSGCRDLILLKCNAAYPAPPEATNLKTIPHLAEAFNTLVGFSDHTPGIGAAVASVAFGACVIEKHVTLSRADGGIDSGFSMEPNEMKLLVKESLMAWKAIGKVCYGTLDAERTTIEGRPSLYFLADLTSGTTIKPEHLGTYRPDLGLPPKEIEHIIGLTLKRTVTAGEPVSWEVFKRM